MIYILPNGTIQSHVVTLVRGVGNIARSLVESTHVCPTQGDGFTVFLEASFVLSLSIIGASL